MTKILKTNPDKIKNIIMLALLSEKTYLSIDEIQKKVPNLILSGRDKTLQQNWFLQEFSDEQIFSAEGTNTSAEGTNAFLSFFVDLKLIEKCDELLGIRLHKGFRKSAYRLYGHIEDYLDKSKLITFTGHSLGGASAIIMGMIAQSKDFNVRVITFGQPRITDSEGSQKYQDFPLTRVVSKKDLIPNLPPSFPFQKDSHKYAHFGHETYLENNPSYSLSDLENDLAYRAANWFVRFLIKSNFFNLKFHAMSRYIINLKSLVGPYKEIDLRLKKK